MKKLLIPNHYVESVFDINIEFLVKQDIKLAIFDLDNTLATNNQHKPSARIKKLLKNFQKNDIEVMIISNNSSKRVNKFCKKLDIFKISSAFKPLKISFSKVLKHFGISNRESIVMIGDQIFTDIIFANRNKIRSILVKPISIDEDAKVTGLNRKLERKILMDIHKNPNVDKIKILKG